MSCLTEEERPEEQETTPSDFAAEPQAAGDETGAQARIAELEDQLLRLRADFENFRRRSRRDQEEARVRALADVLRPLIGQIDNLQRASDAKAADVESLRQGVNLTIRALREQLTALGAQPISARGEAFDPRFHEALMEEESEDVAPGTVLEELQSGWRLGDTLLRPALVKVARAPAADDA